MDAIIAAILDADPGVRPDGHPFHLTTSVEGNAARACDDPDDAYLGYPLIADDVTPDQ